MLLVGAFSEAELFADESRVMEEMTAFWNTHMKWKWEHEEYGIHDFLTGLGRLAFFCYRGISFVFGCGAGDLTGEICWRTYESTQQQAHIITAKDGVHVNSSQLNLAAELN